jgi:hypothetical protein
MGIVKTLLAIGVFGVFMFCMLLFVVILILMFDSLAVTSGVIGLVFFGGGAVISGFLLYAVYHQSRRTPVDDEVQIFGG